MVRDLPAMIGAIVGSALMAASGIFSAERLAVAGVAVIFFAAAFKFAASRKVRKTEAMG